MAPQPIHCAGSSEIFVPYTIYVTFRNQLENATKRPANPTASSRLNLRRELAGLSRRDRPGGSSQPKIQSG
jgi:hypothetical protein